MEYRAYASGRGINRASRDHPRGGGPVSPDPELTARTISAIADEGARLLLTDPKRYPTDRVIGHAEWLLDQLATA